MNDLLNEGCLREMSFRGGEHVLDVGCGTGQFTKVMAEAVGRTGRVVGIERDPNQLAEAVRLNEAGTEYEYPRIDYRAGDATALALENTEWASFDVAHTRFLLEHVPDPQSVIDQMMRAIKIGGRVVLADDDHANFRPWPEPDGFKDIWNAYIESYLQVGNDPFVGRRLVQMLQSAGAERTRNSVVFFGGCRGNSRFDAVAENLIRVLDGARDAMVFPGLISREAFDRGIDGLREWRENPSATLWYYVCWAEGYRVR